MKYTATKRNVASPIIEEGLIIMNMSLEPVGVDGGAAAILGGQASDRGKRLDAIRIPDEIREALSNFNMADLPTTKLRFRLGKDAYNCRTFLIQSPDGVSAPLLGLYLQRDSSVTDAIDVVAAQYHLTDRELEALKGIAIGLTSKEMAERMNISPNTVKSFLRIIMLKMGAATRAGIVGKLLEYSNNSNNGYTQTNNDSRLQ